MRWDIKIAVYLYHAAGFLAVAVMAAPEYLHLSEIANAICFWGGLLGAIMFSTLAFRAAFLGESFKPQRGHVRRMIGLYGMLACGLGFVGFAAAYFWPARSSPDTVVHNTSSTALDYTIKLRCDRYRPSEGTETNDTWYYNIYMTPPSHMDPRDAISTQPVVAGTKIRVDPFDIGKNGGQLRCKLYNQGDKIIISAQFRFTIQWMIDGITNPKDPGGANIAPVEYISPPLDMGNEEGNREAYFYIVNTSDSLLHIVPAETAEVKVAGSDTLFIAKLVSGNQFHNRALLLAGRHFTKIPDASHPVPTPPASPAGK